MNMRRFHRSQALRCLLPLLLLVSPLLRAQPFSPASSLVSGDTRPLSRHPWKTDIVATVFWVGEAATRTSPSNAASSWDHSWLAVGLASAVFKPRRPAAPSKSVHVFEAELLAP